MYDAGKILTGLIIFLALITVPFWYNALISGQADYRPEPKLATSEKQCVAPTDYMKAAHMDFLNRWRDSVVRRGNRMFTTFTGKEIEMSLSNTCMSCHSNKTDFCDKCHTYVGVSPYCWDCHLEPQEVRNVSQ